MKSHVCALNNVAPTEAKLCGRTGEEEGGEEGGSTARGWGGGYPEERKDQEGVSGHGSKTSDAWPGEKGSLLLLQWQWDVLLQSPGFPPPNHPVSPPYFYQNQCEVRARQPGKPKAVQALLQI